MKIEKSATATTATTATTEPAKNANPQIVVSDKTLILMEENMNETKPVDGSTKEQNVTTIDMDTKSETSVGIAKHQPLVHKFEIDSKHGREVKPAYVPFGAIQMPGFFQRKAITAASKPNFEANQLEVASLKTTNGGGADDNKDPSVSNSSRSFRTFNPMIKVLPSLDALKSLRFPFNRRYSPTSTNGATDGGSAATAAAVEKSLTKQKIIDLASAETLNDDRAASFPIVIHNGDGDGVTGAGAGDDDNADDQDDIAVSKIRNRFSNYNPNRFFRSSSVFSVLRPIKQYQYLFYIAIVAYVAIFMLTFTSNSGRKRSPMPPLYNKETVQTLTTCGVVEGLREDGSISFRGVPYARPPVGPNRFRNAQPLNRLEYCWNGTLLGYNTSESNRVCVQKTAIVDGKPHFDGAEDCLTLDVITPFVRNYNLVPVIVMVGAVDLDGPSPARARPSSRYARSRDIVFVRPNFRLGLFGFLALEELTKTQRPLTSGNYGLSDIVEALKWVQSNIANFGGDPTKVTLLGYRAGASLILSLAFSDHSKLFHQVWAFSGSARFPKIDLLQAQAQNRPFLSASKCSTSGGNETNVSDSSTLQKRQKQIVDCLRAADFQQLLSEIPDSWAKPPFLGLPKNDSVNFDVNHSHHWLIQDGDVIKNVSHVNSKKLKIVLGTTAHAAFNEKWARDVLASEWNVTDVRKVVHDSPIGSANLTDDVFALYPETVHGLLEIVTDVRVACPLYNLQQHLRKDAFDVVFYRASQTRANVSNDYDGLDISDIDSDIDAILGRYEPLTTQQRRYFASIQQFFYYFVSHGMFQKPYDPKGPDGTYLEIAEDVIAVANYSRCDFWFEHNFLPKFALVE